MLGQFRKFLNTRAARLFFVVLIVPFVLWGVADVWRNAGRDGSLATVGGQKVEVPAFQAAFRARLAEVTRMLGGRTEPTPAIRQGVAGQVLDGLIVQAAVADEVRRLGLTVPDDALRAAVFAMPAFQGRAGAFDKQRFDAVLRQNNLTEGLLLERVRADLGQRQLMETVQLAATSPDVALKALFMFQHESRVAETVELPFSAAPEPPAPTPEDLHRAYEDDPGRYAAPAYRRIKAVVLSPDTIARGIDVPEADIAAYYESHKAQYGAPEKRTVDVVVSQDEAAATRLAEQWRAGADWAAMQKAAAAAGAATTSLENTPRAELPTPELAEAAFGAAPMAVAGPVKTAFGWQVLQVTAVTPGTERPLEAVHDEAKLAVARERAIDEVYSRVSKLEDVLSAGNSVDEIPADLGAAVAGGTMDAQGNTPAGEPAPIPGSAAVRQAIITAAFAAGKNEPLKLIEGPDQSYFALTVVDETPPETKPFETVEAQVRENWLQDARRRAQETVAAKLLAAVKAGGSLDDAATVAGLRTERTPPIARGTPVAGVPQQLATAVFTLKPNEATMVETPEGFVVARLDAVASPDPATDPAGSGKLRTAMDTSLAQDAFAVVATALRERAQPKVNRAVLESALQ